LSKDINNLRNVSEKSEVDMTNDAVDDLNAQNVSIDLNQLTEQESFVRVLHNVMHQPAPNQAYKVRSRAFLMQKFSEEHAKRSAVISFVQVKQNVIDFSKLLARSAVLVPIAASVVFAFVGGYIFGSEPSNDLQAAKIMTDNNVASINSSPENQTSKSNIAGISLTTNSPIDSVASPQSNIVNSESNQITEADIKDDSDMFASVDPQMILQLQSLQSSLSDIAALADNDQSIDSALLHSLTGNVHAITGYITNNNDLSPTFVMQFLETTTGVISSLATTGNPSGDTVFVAADIATQEGIITVAKYFDDNPDALAIYAANNW
tara:strand:+ start:1559 stop:2521 length:963 start_codon:yes stop_codon:yes gene_type:complete